MLTKFRFSSKKDDSFILLNDRKPVWIDALRITVLYLIFGFLWILFSDNILAFLVKDPQLITKISIAKGFLFVILSALFLYSLLAPAFARLADTEQILRESREELRVLVYYDHLTGLSNRRRLYDDLPEFLAANPIKAKALIFIDMDNIKLVNDSLGHLLGDQLILETARRIETVIPRGDRLFRLGGDEFIVLSTVSTQTEACQLAARIVDAFNIPVHFEGNSIHTSLSIGLALYPEHGHETSELLKKADIALYESKRQGKNRYILFNPSLLTGVKDRMRLGELLHKAQERNELEVFYQPQTDAVHGTVVSFEALLRWKSAELGMISPAQFIPIAEENHLIIPIGKWVLEQACFFLKKLHEQGFSDMGIAVNVSIIQLMQEDFVDTVLTALRLSGIDPNKLELEITESVLMESFSVIDKKLRNLRTLGIGIALDDFGQGYSSLSYLNRLPITVLKIDKVFVDDITGDGAERSITGNIVAIGKKMGLTVIAEGVETESQLLYLGAQHCDKIQGYIFSKPIPEAEAAAYAARCYRNH